MNILIINHYAGSPDMGMEFRPYYFAREWVKMGNCVSILAADFSHLRRVNPGIKSDFEKYIENTYISKLTYKHFSGRNGYDFTGFTDDSIYQFILNKYK